MRERGPENKISVVKFGAFCSVIGVFSKQCIILHLGTWFWFNMGVEDRFPVGMRVLAVDDDETCLSVLENLLRKCQYNG